MSALGWAAVVLLGGVGAVARLLVSSAVHTRLPASLPWGTLAVNLTGALLLGAVAGAGWSHDATLLAGTALLGAYTTFSTWMLDSDALLRDGRRAAAAANLLGSLACGVAGAALTRALV